MCRSGLASDAPNIRSSFRIGWYRKGWHLRANQPDARLSESRSCLQWCGAGLCRYEIHRPYEGSAFESAYHLILRQNTQTWRQSANEDHHGPFRRPPLEGNTDAVWESAASEAISLQTGVKRNLFALLELRQLSGSDSEINRRHAPQARVYLRCWWSLGIKDLWWSWELPQKLLTRVDNPGT